MRPRLPNQYQCKCSDLAAPVRRRNPNCVKNCGLRTHRSITMDCYQMPEHILQQAAEAQIEKLSSLANRVRLCNKEMCS